MRKVTLAVCVVLPAAWRITQDYLDGFIRELFRECARFGNTQTKVILSVEVVGRQDWNVFGKLREVFPDLVIRTYNTASTETSELYLSGFKAALDMKADMILEMDASGGHSPKEVYNFLANALGKLSRNPDLLLSVMSTRFAKGGTHLLPKERVLMSKVGTFVGHTLLGLGEKGKTLTDLTSGFEAFSAPLMAAMFKLQEPSKWVSATFGPLHLFQTEARAMVCWVAKWFAVEVEEKPITFGGDIKRKLAPLSLEYLAKAFIGGLLLAWEGVLVRNKKA